MEQTAKLVSPSVDIRSDVVNFDGKTILVVTILKGLQSPYLANGEILQRAGAQIVPITSGVLYNNIKERTTSNEDVLSEVKRLSMITEQLNKEHIVAKSWRSKVVDWVLGGVIGALISIVLAMLIGIS